MRVFRKLLRDNAAEWVNPQPELGPPHDLRDELYVIATEAVPNRLNGLPVTFFHGDLSPPVAPGPPAPLADDAPPPLTVAYYNRARHGEGLWGYDALIPEGEVE